MECSHCSIWDSIVKACEGDISCWPVVTPHIFWAVQVTIRKDMGFSLFYMAHGIDPILPFDLAKATFLVPKLDKLLSHIDLLTIWACQLEKCESDLNAIKEQVLKAWYTSIAQFKKDNANLIKDFDFMPGLLVLVCNTRIETDLSRKTKPRYLGPLLVVRHNWNNAYILMDWCASYLSLDFNLFPTIPDHALSSLLLPSSTSVRSCLMPPFPISPLSYPTLCLTRDGQYLSSREM